MDSTEISHLRDKLELQLEELEKKIRNRVTTITTTRMGGFVRVDIILVHDLYLHIVVNGETWGWEKDSDIFDRYLRLVKLIRLLKNGATTNEVVYARLQMD